MTWRKASKEPLQYPEVVQENHLPKPLSKPRSTLTITNALGALSQGFLRLLMSLAIPARQQEPPALPSAISTFEDLWALFSSLPSDIPDPPCLQEMKTEAGQLWNRYQRLLHLRNTSKFGASSNLESALLPSLLQELHQLVCTLRQFRRFGKIWQQRQAHQHPRKLPIQILRAQQWRTVSAMVRDLRPGHRYVLETCQLELPEFPPGHFHTSRWQHCTWTYVFLHYGEPTRSGSGTEAQWQELHTTLRTFSWSQQRQNTHQLLTDLEAKARQLLQQEQHEASFSNLRGSHFSRCNFLHVTWNSAKNHLVRALHFEQCNWRQSTIEVHAEGWQCSQGHFQGTTWRQCYFQKGHVVDTRFEGGKIEKTIFEECTFCRVDFLRVQFQEVEFRHCNFVQCQGETCLFTQEIRFVGPASLVLKSPIFVDHLRLTGYLYGLEIHNSDTLSNVFCNATIDWIKLVHTPAIFKNHLPISSLLASAKLRLEPEEKAEPTTASIDDQVPDYLEQLEQKTSILNYIEAKLSAIAADEALSETSKLRQSAFFHRWLEEALEQLEGELHEAEALPEYTAQQFGPPETPQ